MMFGNEALLVLQLHRVEGAAVGIDADQKIVLRRNGEHAISNASRTEARPAKSRILPLATAVVEVVRPASLAAQRRSCRLVPRQLRNPLVDFLKLFEESRIVLVPNCAPVLWRKFLRQSVDFGHVRTARKT